MSTHFNAETHAPIQTHEVGMTRCYEDEEGRLFAVKRIAPNHYSVKTNAIKTHLSVALRHEDNYLGITKCPPKGTPTTFYVALLQ